MTENGELTDAEWALLADSLPAGLVEKIRVMSVSCPGLAALGTCPFIRQAVDDYCEAAADFHKLANFEVADAE